MPTPNVVYIVLGATHPSLLRDHGESYRLSLERLARKNNVQRHVIFHNRFVELTELTEFIGAADLCLTPYLSETQSTSGTPTYYATDTAYDGKMILPQFTETTDFRLFNFITLNGPAVRNKGMALFPRKIGGRYVMLGRQDHQNIPIMFSDHLHLWHSSENILHPKYPWELIQLGNCGSPIETKAGWLVLSHGVGPMRKYCIGAFLLDLEDPTRVLGRLREPLIKPNEDERDGYVPNVVYSCGSLLHGGRLIVPYAMSDYATTFATLPLEEVLAAME